MLTLGFSGAGKDWPRKLNRKICNRVDLAGGVGNCIGSGQGLEDKLTKNPCLLVQTDEIDALIRAARSAKDPNSDGIIRALMTLYTSAGSIYVPRWLAKQEENVTIPYPHVTLLGTATPKSYYQALSEHLMTNGFFSRTMNFEAGLGLEIQNGRDIAPSNSILDVAKSLAAFTPADDGEPFTVPITTETQKIILDRRRVIKKDFQDKCALEDDAVGAAVWSRVGENVIKMSLIYAISKDYQHPQIDEDAVHWADKLVTLQAMRMLHKTSDNLENNPFGLECQKVLKILRQHDGRLPHKTVLTHSHFSAAQLAKVIETLEERERIEIIQTPTKGKTATFYQLKTKA